MIMNKIFIFDLWSLVFDILIFDLIFSFVDIMIF